VQTCDLYANDKPPQQQLFVAAAALYLLTGNPAYKTDADTYWDDNWRLFLFNWNNVPSQVPTLTSHTLHACNLNVCMAR
jgi:hypothetical protein